VSKPKIIVIPNSHTFFESILQLLFRIFENNKVPKIELTQALENLLHPSFPKWDNPPLGKGR